MVIKVNNNLERLIVQDKILGARTRSRSPRRWTDQIKDVTGVSVTDATRKVRNRNRWKRIVRNIMVPS